jgi:hypothetical protein
MSKIEDAFLEFHTANPHVYEALVKLVKRATKRGYKRWSTKGMFEVLRWETSLKTSTEPWKLNNNYTALYARMLVDSGDAPAGFLKLRKGAGSTNWTEDEEDWFEKWYNE